MSIETYTGSNGNGVARFESAPQPPARTQPRTVVRLTEWAESARAAHEVASSLVQTSFVPEQFRNKAHEATAAILAGDEVGLSPMASLRAFDIIQGTAAPRAITHRAVVQSMGHEVWQVEASDSRAVFCGRRRGSDLVQESVWTIDRARQLGLAGKANWKNQPKAMLIARATSEVCRLIASDALMGLPYSIEELTDGVLPDGYDAPDEAGPTETAAPPRRTAQRRSQPRSAAAPTPEPEQKQPPEPSGPPLPGEDGYDEPEQPPDEPPTEDPARAPGSITRAQSTKLHAIFGEAQISKRDTKLGICSYIVGRPLESSSDLSKAEATGLIDTLESMTQRGDLAEQVAEILDAADGGREPGEQS
jgi:hypothetical protein